MSKIHPYPALARLAVEKYLADEAIGRELWLGLADDPELWAPRRGCFVTIKNTDASLRGCIGTNSTGQPDLAWELGTNAKRPPHADARLEPLRQGELAGRAGSADVVTAPGAARNAE